MADGSAPLTSPEHVRGRSKCVCTNADGRCHFGGHYRLPRSRAVAKAMLSGITSIAKADFREWKEYVKSDHMEGMRISRYHFTREQAALLHCCRDPTTEIRAQTVSAIEVLDRAWIQEAEDGLQKEKADHRVAPADVTSPKEASKRRRPSYIASDVERADDWFAHKETRKFPTHESCEFYRRVAQLFDARVVKELPSSGTKRPKTRQRDEDQEEDQTGEEKEEKEEEAEEEGEEARVRQPPPPLPAPPPRAPVLSWQTMMGTNDDAQLVPGASSWSDKEVKALTGLNKACLQQLVLILNSGQWLARIDTKSSVWTPRVYDLGRGRRKLAELYTMVLYTVTRMRLNIPHVACARLFGRDPSTGTRYFRHVLVHMHWMFLQLYPRAQTKEDIDRQKVPFFRLPALVDGSGIVDGSETWLQVPSNLRLHKTFFSTYKGHTTGKVLVLLGLDGKVWWISNVFPGKITDDDLVVQSGMLNIIPANTIVWADKGFSTLPSMRQRGIQVRTPTFKRRNTQFTMAEVKHSQFLSSYRIQERVIGAIKNTCRALHATVDLKEMKLTTSMWHAGALLVNLFHPPFAPQDPDIELSEPTEAEQTVL